MTQLAVTNADEGELLLHSLKSQGLARMNRRTIDTTKAAVKWPSRLLQRMKKTVSQVSPELIAIALGETMIRITAHCDAVPSQYGVRGAVVRASSTSEHNAGNDFLRAAYGHCGLVVVLTPYITRVSVSDGLFG
eukprot:jgi/Chrzof1/9436/Cz04g03020.t1